MDFLLELGLEEIPARMIDPAREELSRRVGDLLKREHLASAARVTSYSTPRRLAVIATGLSATQPDLEEQLTGPALKVAYKDGAPTAAAEAFAKKAGVPLNKLSKTTTPKGEYLTAIVTRKGRSAAEVLAELLPKEMASLYWAKNMYWRGKTSERYVRPVRWLVALLDGKVIPLEFAGVKAAATSRGHRILSKGEVKISTPAKYAESLAAASVIVSQEDREYRIRKALDAATRTVPGARWRADDALKATVVNLTEFPSAIIGDFDREFLSLPEEVLVTVMRDHQKYFALEDAAGKLAPHFLAVLNNDGDPEGLIRHGNERVLRARFNDARFFWDTDQRTPLNQRLEMLKAVTFQKDLGSYYDKAGRIAHLTTILGADVSAESRTLDRNALHLASWLCKVDLTTELVKEFTELQGIVGGLYARAQSLAPAAVDAIYDHYKPASIEDSAPRTLEGALLAIGDKADSIAGMFALGLQPTGSKDPFGLRRQANGIVKIIAEHGLAIDLTMLFNLALVGYRGSVAEKKFGALADFSSSVALFLRERLEFYLRDVKGFAYDVVNAVLAAGSSDVMDAIARAAAVSEMRNSADFGSIALSFKRMKNILRQAHEAGKPPSASFDRGLTVDAAEKALADQLHTLAPQVAELRAARDYSAALARIATLRPALDAFFDQVMVMAEDSQLRGNRLALLTQLLADLSTIADFSEIVTEKR